MHTLMTMDDNTNIMLMTHTHTLTHPHTTCVSTSPCTRIPFTHTSSHTTPPSHRTRVVLSRGVIESAALAALVGAMS